MTLRDSGTNRFCRWRASRATLRGKLATYTGSKAEGWGAAHQPPGTSFQIFASLGGLRVQNSESMEGI